MTTSVTCLCLGLEIGLTFFYFCYWVLGSKRKLKDACDIREREKNGKDVGTPSY